MMLLEDCVTQFPLRIEIIRNDAPADARSPLVSPLGRRLATANVIRN